MFQIFKLLKIFYDMINFDIFLIDFERPRENFFQSSNKSHPGTPSISSSLKPAVSTPVSDCVSAWRNYFVANEFQELMTRRPISINIHIFGVIAAFMVRCQLKNPTFNVILSLFILAFWISKLCII